MKVKEASFQVVKNLGNYETVRYSVTIIPDEGEKLNFDPIRKAIERQHKKMYAVPATKFTNTARADQIVKPNK